MNAAKIVIGKMQSNRKTKVIEFLGKGISQACEPANCHSYTEVLALHEASRNIALARVADSYFGYNLDDWAWGVPLSSMLAVIAIQLHELREVHVQTKRFLDNLGIEVESVSGQLDLIGQPLVQVSHKCSRVLDGTLTDTERCDEFSFRVHRDEYPLVANLAVAVAHLALFLLDKRPYFIALHIAAVEAVQTRIQQLLATLSGKFQEAHDRVPIESCEPLRAPDRAALNEALNSADCSIFAGTHRAKRGLRLRFGKRCRAGIAAPALDSALAVGAEPLAGLVVTSDASHGISPLDFCAEKGHNELWSGLWLTPRFGLAPQPVSAGSGALSVRGYLGWWLDRDYHGLTVSEVNCDCDRHADFILSESPVPAGLSYLRTLAPRLLVAPHPGLVQVRRRTAALLHLMDRVFEVIRLLCQCSKWVLLPSVSTAEVHVASHFQFASLFHSPHGSVYACQLVFVVTCKVESHFQKHGPYHLGGKHCLRIAHRCSAYYGADGVSQTQSVTARLLSNERRKSGDCLEELSLSLGKPSLLAFDLGQFQAGLLQSVHEFVSHLIV
jgi:hypothetical protein